MTGQFGEIFNSVNGTEQDVLSEEDGDDDDNEIDTDDIQLNIPMKESDFKELFENSDYDLYKCMMIGDFFTVNEWNITVFMEICKIFFNVIYM